LGLAVDLVCIAPVVNLALKVSQEFSRETVAKVLRHDSKTRVHNTGSGYRLQDGGNGRQTVEGVYRVFVSLCV
jgi:hypothetical protein